MAVILPTFDLPRLALPQSCWTVPWTAPGPRGRKSGQFLSRQLPPWFDKLSGLNIMGQFNDGVAGPLPSLLPSKDNTRRFHDLPGYPVQPGPMTNGDPSCIHHERGALHMFAHQSPVAFIHGVHRLHKVMDLRPWETLLGQKVDSPHMDKKTASSVTESTFSVRIQSWHSLAWRAATHYDQSNIAVFEGPRPHHLQLNVLHVANLLRIGKVTLQHPCSFFGHLWADVPCHRQFQNIGADTQRPYPIKQTDCQDLYMVFHLRKIPTHLACCRMDPHGRESVADAETSPILGGITGGDVSPHHTSEVHLGKRQCANEPDQFQLHPRREIMSDNGWLALKPHDESPHLVQHAQHRPAKHGTID